MLFHFYDIESLSNVFMLADYKPEINELDIYHLVDSADAFDHRNPSDDDVIGEISYRIHLRNQNFNGKVNIFDLHDRGAVERLAYEIEREIGEPVHLPVLRHVALREKDVKMGVPAEVPSVGVEEGDVAEPSSFPLCCVGSVPRQKEIQSLLCGAEKDVQHRIPVFPHQRPEIGRDGEDHLPVGDVRQRLRHVPRYPFPCQLTAGGTEAGLACPADHHRLSAVRTDVHDEA